MPIDPADWLALAQHAVTSANPSETELRRAVSAAYYAVFHAVVKTATESFLGTALDDAYRVLYRSYQHPEIKDLCKRLDVSKIDGSDLVAALGFEWPSNDVRQFARGFVNLQEKRHLADYNPILVQSLENALALVQQADSTIAAFQRIPSQTQRAILLYMRVGIESMQTSGD